MALPGRKPVSDLLGQGAAAALEKALDVAAYREQIIASNVANVDTPGYRARDISFKEELRRASSDAFDPLSVPAKPGATVHEAVTGRLRGDGNTVDIDREMLNLASTAGFYTTSVEMIKKYVGMLKSAITDGRM
jgi:flagellar basal-body rod protein FlgB